MASSCLFPCAWRPHGAILKISLGRLVKVTACTLNEGGSRTNNKSDWILENIELVRASPIAIGVTSFAFTFFNRTLAGVAPVVSATSSQSRADVLVIALSTTVILTGLTWISVRPKRFLPVELEGVECMRFTSGLPKVVEAELRWVWEALKRTSCARVMVIACRKSWICQAGIVKESAEKPGQACDINFITLLEGSVCQNALASGKQTYMANVSLYPGRFQLPFLPSNTQAVIVQPIGQDGVMIIGGDRIRGFLGTDQRWIVSLAEKLDVTLQKTALFKA